MESDAVSLGDVVFEEKSDLESIISFIHSEIIHEHLLSKVFKLVGEKKALLVKR